MTIETVTAETLTDFNNARMRVQPEPVKEEPKAEEAKAEELKEEAGEAKEEQEEAEKPAPKKGNHKIESRFSELTAKARAAEERANAAEARAAAAEAKAAPQRSEAATNDEIGPEPKAADYTDAFDYAKDLAEWSTNKAMKERDRADIMREQAKVRDKVVGEWKSRVDAVKAEKPDWTEMVESSKAQVSNPARDALIESEYGPSIVYDLAADDELAAQVSSMTPAAQLRWIGKMEAKYESKAEASSEEKLEPVVKERPKAPAPITPVRGVRNENSLDSPGEYKGTFAQYKADRLRQMSK